jgi:hypothetical protein
MSGPARESGSTRSLDIALTKDMQSVDTLKSQGATTTTWGMVPLALPPVLLAVLS